MQKTARQTTRSDFRTILRLPCGIFLNAHQTPPINFSNGIALISHQQIMMSEYGPKHKTYDNKTQAIRKHKKPINIKILQSFYYTFCALFFFWQVVIGWCPHRGVYNKCKHFIRENKNLVIKSIQ